MQLLRFSITFALAQRIQLEHALFTGRNSIKKWGICHANFHWCYFSCPPCDGRFNPPSTAACRGRTSSSGQGGYDPQGVRSRLRHSRWKRQVRSQRRYHRGHPGDPGHRHRLGSLQRSGHSSQSGKISDHDKLYFLATHFHPEHAGGSSAFPASARFLVSTAQQRALDERGLDFVARFSTFSPVMGELLKDVQFRPPDIVFEHEHNLDLGGIRVRILSLGPTHTPGDTMVWVEEDRVLFAGDVVMNRTFLSFNQDSSARPGCPSSISWRRFAPAPSYPAMETWATPL